MSSSPSSISPKKWVGLPRWLFLVLLCCVAIGVLIAGGHRVSEVFVPHINELHELTTNLPDVERIEIELVHVNFETIDKVLDSKTLVGAETQELTNLWRSQSYSYDGHVMCHAPLYRIRFYKNNALVTEATVCFHCHNIYFYKYAGAKSSEEPLDATFDFSRDDQSYTQFRDYLSSLFPHHDVEAESTQKPN